MTTHSSILAWKIPWVEEPGQLQSMGVAKGRTRLSTSTGIIPNTLFKKKSYVGHVVTKESTWAFHANALQRLNSGKIY